MAVYEDYTEDAVRTMLQESIQLPDDGSAEIAELIRRTPQQRYRWPTLPWPQRPTVSAAVAIIASAFVVALVGGFLLSGLALGPSDPETVPAAVPQSASPEATARSSPTAVLTEPPAPTSVPTQVSVDWPRDGKTRLVIEQASDTMVEGQTQRVTARWCQDGDCRPADDIEWRVDTTKVLKVKPKTGSWTEVEATGPGVGIYGAWIGKRQHASPVIWVYPKPGAGAVPAAVTPRRVDVAYPNEVVVELGQHFVLTGWRCPTRDAKQLGRDAVPGTDDDDCKTKDLSDITAFKDSGVALVGMAGQSAVLVAEAFIGLDYPLDADPVRLSYADRADKQGLRPMRVGNAHVYVRNRDWKGPALGDLDGDRSVDQADLDLLTTTLEAAGPRITPASPAWRASLDLNVDHQIDGVDRSLLELLVRSHAGDLVPERLTWWVHVDNPPPPGLEPSGVASEGS